MDPEKSAVWLNEETLNSLDALDGRGQYAGRGAAGLGSAHTCEIGGVPVTVAGHVVRVIAAVQHEDVLLREGSSHLTGGRGSGLENGERRDVASQVGEKCERF
jgi:hypothetical protein